MILGLMIFANSVQTFTEIIGEAVRYTRLKRSTKIRCTECNALHPVDTKFCNQCGSSLEKTRMCPDCNENNDSDANFCDNCGKAFN